MKEIPDAIRTPEGDTHDVERRRRQRHQPGRRHDQRSFGVQAQRQDAGVLEQHHRFARGLAGDGECFGERLVFPGDFVGRGDMSRGGLLLRCVTAAVELPYVPIAGAVSMDQVAALEESSEVMVAVGGP